MSTLRNILRKLTPARITHHVAPGAAAILIAGLAVACADGPTSPAAPQPAPQAPAASLGSLVGGLTGTVTTLVNGVLWLHPVTEIQASATIGANGGTLTLADGVKLTVPRGAVSQNTTFSITRQPGLIVAYDFQPHGTRFNVPLQVEVPTGGTNLLGLLRLNPNGQVSGAYYSDASLLNQILGIAVVSEFRPTTVTSDKALVRFSVDHFSGYMVAWGRGATSGAE